MSKEQVTIRDLALKLNISISTVSRALRGAQEINAETKKAVLELAEKLNYEPNLIAQSLRKSKTNTIGIIVPEIANPFFSTSISGIQEVASKEGYNIMICQSNESYNTEVANVRTLMNSRVDGLLMSLSRETKDFGHIIQLHKKGVPFVLFDRIFEDIDASKVIVDDRDGAFKAVEHLILQGRKRIAHLAGPENLQISNNRIKGYRDALDKHGLAIDDTLVIHCNALKDAAAAETKKLLDMPNPPDAIFTFNDPMAIISFQVIKEMGLKIPEDVALVGFTDEPVSSLLEPSLTTISQPAMEMGRIATELLLNMMKNPGAYVPETRILKTELIIRQSSGKRLSQ